MSQTVEQAVDQGSAPASARPAGRPPAQTKLSIRGRAFF